MSKPLSILLAAATMTAQAAPARATEASAVVAEEDVVIMNCELHFQEGFGGETLVVAVDGVEVARFIAKTRMQIGLAHIEKLTLKVGQTVTIRLIENAVEASHVVEAGKPFIQVMIEVGALRIQSTERSPGYV
jgi:hypothetical protein